MRSFTSTASFLLVFIPYLALGQFSGEERSSTYEETKSSHSAIYILRKAFEHTDKALLKDQPFSLALSVYASASSQDSSYHYNGLTTYEYKKGYVSQDIKFLRNYREMAENPVSGISEELLADRRFWGGIFLEDDITPPCPTANRTCWNKKFPISTLHEVSFNGKKVYQIQLALPTPKGAWLEGAYVGKPFKYEVTFLVEAGSYIILRKESRIYGENTIDQDKESDPLLRDYKRTDRIWVSIQKDYINYLGNYFLAKAKTTYQTQYYYPILGTESEIYTTEHEFLTDRINLDYKLDLPAPRHAFYKEWRTIEDEQNYSAVFEAPR